MKCAGPRGAAGLPLVAAPLLEVDDERSVCTRAVGASCVGPQVVFQACWVSDCGDGAVAAGVLPRGTARVQIKHLCWSLLGTLSVQVVLLGVFKPRQNKKKHPFLLTSPAC